MALFYQRVFFLSLALSIFCILVSTDIRAEVFFGDFESGNLDLEKWQVDKSGECTIEVVSEADDHGRAARFNAGDSARCEVVPRVYKGLIGDYLAEPFERTRWYRFSVLLEEPWPLDDGNEVIAQWHSTRDKFFGDPAGRGPPLAIRIVRDYFHITHGWDRAIISTRKHLASKTLWLGGLRTGTWLEWTVEARWSFKDSGVLRIWLNRELIAEHFGPNTYNDIRGVYLKLGSYHPRTPRHVRLDDVYIGNQKPEF